MSRPLSPTTVELYDGVLTRAFGSKEGLEFRSRPAIPPAVAGWTESNKALLRAAVRRKCADSGMEEKELEAYLAGIPVEWAASRVTVIPSEKEMEAFEGVARSYPPGRRVLALLPLALGLRAREAITLTRKAVERALDSGELLVMRKGGFEQLLPAVSALPLLSELVAVKGMKRNSLFESALLEGKPWTESGKVISTGNHEAAYHALHRLVRGMGDKAKIDELHPHLLRHAFATRMARDGAPLPTIQWMLGHSDVKTTMRYVHPGMADAAKYTRKF